MAKSETLSRFLSAIGYPAELPPGASAFPLVVDGYEVTAAAEEDRIVLSHVLRREDGAAVDLAPLAAYAAGRILKEEAILAWDPEAEAPLLWQEVSSGAEDRVLRRFFEVFATSCDWWRARLGEAQDGERIPEMVIMP